jgi:hypothetical protein
MRKLRITGCSDSSMWYAGMVGQVVELLGADRREYLSREPAGYVNIVKKSDAEVVCLQLADLVVDGVSVGKVECWLPAEPLSLDPDGFRFYGALAVDERSKVQRYKDAKPKW